MTTPARKLDRDPAPPLRLVEPPEQPVAEPFTIPPERLEAWLEDLLVKRAVERVRRRQEDQRR